MAKKTNCFELCSTLLKFALMESAELDEYLNVIYHIIVMIGHHRNKSLNLNSFSPRRRNEKNLNFHSSHL